MSFNDQVGMMVDRLLEEFPEKNILDIIDEIKKQENRDEFVGKIPKFEPYQVKDDRFEEYSSKIEAREVHSYQDETTF